MNLRIPALLLLSLFTLSAGTRDDAEKPGVVRGRFTSLERMKTKGETSERDVVVYLKPAEPKPFPAPKAPFDVEQKDLAFQPHVLAVPAGSKVRFKNLDAVLHNVFSSDACCDVNVDMAESATNEIELKKPGVASIICRLHPDMSMFIVVLDTPYFTRIEVKKEKLDDGESEYAASFEIPNVPPGKYTLTFWNKAIPPREVPVSVTAGGEVQADIVIEKQ